MMLPMVSLCPAVGLVLAWRDERCLARYHGRTMDSLAAISLSGMSAAQTQLSVSAHNVANGMTEGFHRQSVELQASANGGVTAMVITDPQAQQDAMQNLVQDVVQQLQAKNAFLANLQVFRSNNQVLGTLVNLQA